MPYNFIDAVYLKRQDEVLVWERDENRHKRIKRYPAPYYFYVEDDKGPFVSLYGKRLKKLQYSTNKEFEQATRQYNKKYESDIRPLEKVLMENYYNIPPNSLNYTLLDIEVDYSSDIGFAGTDNPYAPINAITLFHQWSNKYITYAVVPPSWVTAKKQIEDIIETTDNEQDARLAIAAIFDALKIPITSKISMDYHDWIDVDLKQKSEIVLCVSERDLLTRTLESIRDSDILSGWNSDFFDMPYLVLRTEKVLGKAYAAQWCFAEGMPPYFREVEMYGKPQLTVTLSGRKQIDYKQLFEKFNFTSRDSMALANVAREELKLEKLTYEGSLENLYVRDFNFFIRYNIRDVEILEGLDNKFGYIDLTNELAHVNTVQLNKVMGSVDIIDTGIINYAHNVRKIIVCDKNPTSGEKIEGALVLIPKMGIHKWVGAIDINSLYPSTYRALNISPEKIIGQFARRKQDWTLITNRDSVQVLRLNLEDGSYAEYTGAEFYEIFNKKNWAVSAYGTVFDLSSGQGLIPGVLSDWYAERVRLKGIQKDWGKKAKDKSLTEAEREHAKEMEDFYDRKQHTYKILLNSAYGATVNQWCRFYDPRLGASTTGTGKQITTFMMQRTAEILTGEFPEVKETIEVDEDGEVEYVYTCDNPAIVYSDTDSCYFKMLMATTVDEAVAIADEVGKMVNESFPAFLKEKFLSTEGYNDLIQCGRELVADNGLFQTKKKYVLHVVDKEGKRVDDIKAMGSDIKKKDTPKYIQDFLKNLSIEILAKGQDYDAIETFVNNFRTEFKTVDDPMRIGIPKACNKLEQYTREYEMTEALGRGKCRLPGNVRASINHNQQIKIRDDKRTASISSGGKIRIYYLKPNEFNYTSIAISADVDELPWWFHEHFKIDMKLMEQKLITDKVKLLFAAIGWEVPTHRSAKLRTLLEY